MRHSSSGTPHASAASSASAARRAGEVGRGARVEVMRWSSRFRGDVRVRAGRRARGERVAHYRPTGAPRDVSIACIILGRGSWASLGGDVMSERGAVVLLSGGLDSTTCLAWARARFACTTLAVDYGQRHRAELDHARQVARSLGIADHRQVSVDLRAIGGSALTGDAPVPLDRTAADMATGIPATYVPARNTVLLALALGLAETLGARDLVAGNNAVDHP